LNACLTDISQNILFCSGSLLSNAIFSHAHRVPHTFDKFCNLAIISGMLWLKVKDIGFCIAAFTDATI
jgi:hypothetical protein